MDLQHTCRACLKTGHSDRLFSLFEEPLKSMFYECTFIKVRPGDQFPYHICTLCVALCDAAYNFREMCEANDRKIRSGDLPVAAVVSLPSTPPPTAVLDEPVVVVEKVTEAAAPPSPEEQILEFEDPIESIEEEVDEEEMVEDEVTEIIVSAGGEEEYDPDASSQDTKADDYNITSAVEPIEGSDCQFCTKVFLTKMNLLDHYAEDHQDENYSCSNCNQLFGTLDIWRKHLCRRPLKDKRTYVCDFCSEVYQIRRMFALHLAEKHPGQNYRCDKCDKTYVNAETWRTHMCASDAWEYVCNFCETTFGFQAQLSRHLKSHFANSRAPAKKSTYKHQMIPCHVCKATFHSPSYLKKHQQIHTGEMTSHSCSICRRPFRNKCNLLRHLRVIHKETNIRFSDLK